ncbi:ABC transporter ATP-binding protein [Candidatus Micrarchaeota archaeon]|nr:ABC transporter ATP-binding protein [Candidatus Micrarchaeota archaeon]
MNAVVLERLCKSFGSKKVLDEVSLSVPGKKIYCLSGSNGSGKTTLLNIIAGVLAPSSGKASVTGRVGYCYQVPRTCDDLTVKENLAFFSKIVDARDSKWLKELVELVGLKEWLGVLAGELSTGMKKRVEIAVALLADPEILLFDEPTTGVDAETREKILELVKKMRGKKTMLIASHELFELRNLCDKTIKIENGKIKEK